MLCLEKVTSVDNYSQIETTTLEIENTQSQFNAIEKYVLGGWNQMALVGHEIIKFQTIWEDSLTGEVSYQWPREEEWRWYHFTQVKHLEDDKFVLVFRDYYNFYKIAQYKKNEGRRGELKKKKKIDRDIVYIDKYLKSNKHYIVYTSGDKVGIIKYDDMKKKEEYKCIEEDGYNLKKENFGCAGITVYQPSQNQIYILTGLYTKFGKTHPNNKDTRGVIIKEIDGDRELQSEQFWNLCVKDSNCNLYQDAAIPMLYIAESGSVKYLYTLFSVITYEIESIEGYQIDVVDQMPISQPICVDEPPPPPPDDTTNPPGDTTNPPGDTTNPGGTVRRILAPIPGPTDPVPPVDPPVEEEEEERICPPDPEELVADLEAIVNLPDGLYWVATDSEYVQYQRTTTTETIYIPNAGYNVIKVIKNFQDGIGGDTPSSFQEFDVFDVNTDISVKSLVYYNIGDCFKQYHTILRVDKILTYQIYDIDLPYYFENELGSQPTILEQIELTTVKPHVDIPYVLELDASYFTGYDTGNLEFQVSGTPSWATIDSENLKIEGTPTLSFLDVESTMSIDVVNTESNKKVCDIPLKIKVYNIPPVVTPDLQGQIEGQVGDFITESYNEFKSVLGCFTDHENQPLTISFHEVKQIDTSSAFKDETVLTNLPDWLKIQISNSPNQITVIGDSPPQKDSKYEYKLTFQVDDGVDQVLEQLTVVIASFKNPFLGIEYSSNQFSQNEQALDIGQYIFEENQYIAVLVQDLGIQINKLLNPRVQEEIIIYPLTSRFIDSFFLNKNDKAYVFINYGGNSVQILDITDPLNIVELTAISGLTQVKQIKKLTISENLGEDDEVDVDYIAIFDRDLGLVIGDFTNPTDLVNIIQNQYASLGDFSDFMDFVIDGIQYYAAIENYDMLILQGGPTSYSNMSELFRVRRDFLPKQIEAFEDSQKGFLVFTTKSHGLNILKLQTSLIDSMVASVSGCNKLFDLTDSSNNSSGTCNSLKYEIELAFATQLDLKNAVDMYLYQEKGTKMLIVSDGYLGVKLISVNFPASPKVVAEYSTFDAQRSVHFEFEDEIYLAVADERQGNKFLQLIQGTTDKPFYSYAQDIAILNGSESGLEYVRWSKSLKIDKTSVTFLLDGVPGADDDSIVMYNTTLAQNPTKLASFSTSSQIKSLDLFPYQDNSYLFQLKEDMEFTISQIKQEVDGTTGDITFSLAPQTLSIDGSPSTIEDAVSFGVFFFDRETFVVFISNMSSIVFYQLEVTGEDAVNLSILIDDTTLTNIVNTNVQVIKLKQTFFFFDQTTKKVKIYQMTDSSTIDFQSQITLENYMYTPLFYEQKVFDEYDPTVMIQHNEIIVFSDGVNGIKFFKANSLNSVQFLHQINTYDTKFLKLLNFESSGLFLAYTDSIKGFRILQLNLDIEDNLPQQRVVYYTDQGPTQHMDIRDQDGRIYGFLSDGYSGFKVVELSSDLGMYPKLGVIVENDSKQFTVKLYPVYKNTLSAYLYNSKLLDVLITEASRKILNPMPYWTTVNLQARTVNLIPPEQDNLKQTQFIYYKFSKEIDPQILLLELMGEDGEIERIYSLLELLQQYGYVSSTKSFFLTNNFDPTAQQMMLPNIDFEPSVIFSSLKQFYYEGFIELNTKHFAKLNSAPVPIVSDYNEIQQEFEKQVGNPLKVGQKFVYEFFTMFIDLDNDPIRYVIGEIRVYENRSDYQDFYQLNQEEEEAEEVPPGDVRRRNLSSYTVLEKIEYLPWLNYNQNERLFTGKPTADYLDKIIEIEVQADDGYSTGSLFLMMDITDQGPYLVEDNDALLLQSQYNVVKTLKQPHPLDFFSFIVNYDLFQDPEGDQLYFEAEVQECLENQLEAVQTLLDNGNYETLKTTDSYWETNITPLNSFVEYWLNYDSLTGEFKGTPQVENIGIFKIKMTGFDLNKSVSDTFIMTVTNEGPFLHANHLLRLQNQYNSMLSAKAEPHPYQPFKFVIDMNLFQDLEEDDLRYYVDVQKHLNDQEQTIKNKYENEEFDDLLSDSTLWNSGLLRLSPNTDIWMKFDVQFGEIIGTPKLADLGYYKVTITAEDMTKTISDSFVMSVTNIAPDFSQDTSLTLQNQYQQVISHTQIPHPYNEFEFNVQMSRFQDLEGDELTFSVSVKEIKPEKLAEGMTLYYSEMGVSTLNNPDSNYWGTTYHLTLYEEYWLKFDPQFNKIYGTPIVDNIGLYIVIVTGSDMNSSVTDSFVMSVENQGPFLSQNNSLKLQNQYTYMVSSNQKPHPYVKFSLILQLNLFQDLEGDTLNYQVEMWKNYDDKESLIIPLFNDQQYQNLIEFENFWTQHTVLSSFEDVWLKFDGISELFGTPDVSDLGYYRIKITASDMNQEISDMFVMSITNDGPVLSNDITTHLQSQYQNYLNNNPNPHPTRNFRLEVKNTVFEDPEQDNLQYQIHVRKSKPDSVEQIKELFDAEQYSLLKQDTALWSNNYIQLSSFVEYWLKYDQDTFVLEGIPNVEDLGYLYITIIATDMTDTISDSFFMSITNVEPILSPLDKLSLQNQYNFALTNTTQYPHPLREFKYQIDSKLFIDEEDDNLSYFVEAQVQEDDEYITEQLQEAYEQNNFDLLRNSEDFWVRQKTPLYSFVPYWLKFDEVNKEFYGIPEVIDYKFFLITVTVSDMTGSVTDSFVIKVLNEIPFLNDEIKHEVPGGRVDSKWEYIFDEETFVDPENDPLNFRVRKIPEWMEFDPNQRKLKGTPPLKGFYEVQIEAIDVVNEVQVYKFEFEIDISWLQLIMIIIGMLSPFASLLTILKHKQQIYAILCKRKYQYMRYHLAPINKVFVKQIPLVRLELTEIQDLYSKMRKRGMQELRLKHGKKNKIYKKWIENLYYDEETGEFDKEQIIDDMIKIAKENNIKSILSNFSKNKQKISHYYIMIKAQFARTLLKKNYQGWKIYQGMKKSLKTVPVYHFDDKGRKTRSVKSNRDWYKCLIAKVDYDYMIQELNMFPNYQINEVLLEQMLRQQQQEIQQKYIKSPKIVPLEENKFHVLTKLVEENVLAEINGILTEYLGPLSGPAHGESLVIRPQNIKSLEAYCRIDTYNSGNKLIAKLSFLKMDYVPLAGSVNDVLPEWLNFTINNGVLEFQGIPPVDYLGRHLMIRIISNTDFILEEFFIKFSDDVQETQDKEKLKEGAKKKFQFLTGTQEAKPFKGATLYSTKKKNKKEKQFSSIQPNTRYLAASSDIAIFQEMKKQSIRKLQVNLKKVQKQLKQQKNNHAVIASEFTNLEISLYSIEQVSLFVASQDEQVKTDLFNMKQRNIWLMDFDLVFLYRNLEALLKKDKVNENVQKSLTLFAALIFNDKKILEITVWKELRKKLRLVDEETDFTIANYRDEEYEIVRNKIVKNYENEPWFKITEPDDNYTVYNIIYQKWIQIIVSSGKILDLQGDQEVIDELQRKVQYGLSKKKEVEQQIEKVYKIKENQENKVEDLEKKEQMILDTLQRKKIEQQHEDDENDEEKEQEEEKKQNEEDEMDLNEKFEEEENLKTEEAINMKTYPRFVKSNSNLELRTEFDNNILCDLFIISYYRDQVIQQNPNNAIFINYKLISDKRDEIIKKVQTFIRKYRKAIDFNSLVEQEIDMENIFSISNFCCAEGYPDIQKKWTIIFYMIANALELTIDLKYLDIDIEEEEEEINNNNEDQMIIDMEGKQEQTDQQLEQVKKQTANKKYRYKEKYKDLIYKPFIGTEQQKQQLVLVDEEDSDDGYDGKKINLNFNGKISHGFFSITLKNFFKEGTGLDYQNNFEYNSDKLFKNFSEIY